MKARVANLVDGIRLVKGGIASKTLVNEGGSKCVLFRFDKGQQLSEHTASVAATIHFVDGKADVLLGKKNIKAGPGTWVHMPAGLLHAITAKTRLVMLLTLLPGQHSSQPACKE